MKTARDARSKALAERVTTPLPESWPIDRELDESYQAANQSVRAHSARQYANTMSALVVRQRRWIIDHVGDTRVWRRRDHKRKSC